MAQLTFREAVQSDHVSLEALFAATPMGSQIRLCFERDPDFFAGSMVQSVEPCVRGFFDDNGQAVGIFSAGIRRVWLDGEVTMRYLSDLRIHQEYQGGSLLARGFRKLRDDVFAPGEWAQTLVLEDNMKALELLQSRRAGLPDYRAAGRYISWLLAPQRVASKGGWRVRRATMDDLPAMRELLAESSKRRSFADLTDLLAIGGPRWRNLALSDFLLAEGRCGIRGMLGLWEQSGFNRMRVCGYSPATSMIRPVWNGFAWISNRVTLPPVGELVRARKATAVACVDDDPAILRALLAAALGGKDAIPLLVGFSAADPLCSALMHLSAHRSHGRHFLVGWDGTPPEWKEPFSFDLARI